MQMISFACKKTSFSEQRFCCLSLVLKVAYTCSLSEFEFVGIIIFEIHSFSTFHFSLLIHVLCSSRNIHTPPTEGIGISWGVGGSVRPKNLKKCMKLNWNFQRGGGGGVLEKIPSVGEVWIFSGITHYVNA